MNEPTFSDAELKALNSGLQSRYGLDFSGYESKSYRRRLHRVVRLYKLDGLVELWRMMLKDPDFVHVFINELSVGLTSLFRDPVMWVGLRNYLENLSPRPQRLRVWHAGCSSGEEVYSFAILLKELGWKHPVEVLATDMSHAALDKARAGIWFDPHLPEYERNYKAFNPKGNLKQYYQGPVDGVFQMDTQLVRHVQWSQHNLVQDPYPGPFDIIFCRNVMIYFDTPTKNRLIPNFYKALRPGGLFIIGFFDALVPLLSQYAFTALSQDTKIFFKVPAD